MINKILLNSLKLIELEFIQTLIYKLTSDRVIWIQ